MENDFARAIIEAFAARRERGSAVSAVDEQLLLDWELQGMPVVVVLEGIDTAFERKSTPPKSLQECGRWVRAAFARWTGEMAAGHDTTAVGVDGPSASGGGASGDDRPATVAAAVDPGPTPDRSGARLWLDEVLGAWLDGASSSPLVHAALVELEAETLALGADRWGEPQVAAAAARLLGELVLAKLPPSLARSARAAGDRAAAASGGDHARAVRWSRAIIESVHDAHRP